MTELRTIKKERLRCVPITSDAVEYCPWLVPHDARDASEQAYNN